MRRLSIPILTLVLACAMLGGAIAFRAQRSGAHGPRPLVTFEPRDVIEITTRRDASGPEALVRRAYPNQNVGARWLVRIGSATAPEWPANETNILGALRVLAGSDAVPLSGPTDALAFPRTMELAVVMRDTAGHQVTARRLFRMAFAESSVAGVVAARVEGGWTGSVDAAVADALFSPGPSGWRDRSALPGVGADASRISIEWPGGAVSLAKLGGGWFMTSPIGMRANPEQVRSVIATLTALVVARFADEAPVSGAATNEALPSPSTLPAMTIRVDTGSQAPQDDPASVTQMIVRTLCLDSRASASAREAPALVALGLDAPEMSLVLNAEALLALPRDWSAYASSTATDVRAADIASIRIEREGAPTRTLGRRLGEWIDESAAAAPTGATAPIPSDAREDAEAILTLVCETAASRMTPDDGADPAFVASATVTLLDIRGETLDTIFVGTARDAMNSSATDNPTSAASLERHASGSRVIRLFGSAPLPSALSRSR